MATGKSGCSAEHTFTNLDGQPILLILLIPSVGWDQEQDPHTAGC